MAVRAGGITIRKDFRKLDALIRETPMRGGQFMRAVAQAVVSDIVLSFGSSPSAAGDPPGVDTGALRGSIHFEKQGAFTYWIMDGVAYGVYLEYGTERMAARPFFSPVLEEWRARRLGQFAQDFGLVQ